jgi:hypothetical protein
MNKPNVFCGIPVRDGISVPTVCLLVPLNRAFEKNGIKFHLEFSVGNSFLPGARNELAARFLASDASHMLCIDADVAVSPETVFKMLLADKDFISVACVRREVKGTASEQAAPECIVKLMSPIVNGIAETDVAYVACAAIKRCVFERILAAEGPGFTYAGHSRMMNAPDATVTGTYANFFGPLVEDVRLLAEDEAFCRRWARVGGKQHVLVDADSWHAGQTFNLAKSL